MPLTYVYSHQESYDPLARIDGVADLRFPGSTAILDGMPERMMDSEGQVRWRGVDNAWCKLLRKGETQISCYSQDLSMQGQYL